MKPNWPVAQLRFRCLVEIHFLFASNLLWQITSRSGPKMWRDGSGDYHDTELNVEATHKAPAWWSLGREHFSTAGRDTHIQLWTKAHSVQKTNIRRLLERGSLFAIILPREATSLLSLSAVCRIISPNLVCHQLLQDTLPSP